jgi:hypothetical protein
MGAGLIEEVRAFVAAPEPAALEPLALRVFALQYEGNEPYRRFCDRRGRNPGNVGSIDEIPPIPVSAFKALELRVAGLPEGAIYLTSGTTGGPERRGRHVVADPSLYRDAARSEFVRAVLPDGARPRFVVLAPAFAERPESSLCQMIDWLAEELSPAPAEHFVRDGAVLVDALASRLRELESAREPVLLVGVTHAFIRFFDACRVAGARFRLPYGSRIVDTGGTKGRSRPMSRAGLLRAFWDLFGVPGPFVVNEYGMTEMSSQFYDDALRSHVDGRKRDRSKVPPPWVQTRVVSAETLEPVARGARGLLRHFDLANVGSVSALLTEDVGHEVGEGFEILGRAEGAEARGCAFLIEDGGA